MSGPIYFLSDLHLMEPEAPRAQRLLSFLGELKEAQALYLLGDIFDFWLGYSISIPGPYFPFLRALAELSEAGVKVVYLAGNHDPDPGPFFKQIGVETHRGGLSLNLGGRSLRLEHGDLIYSRYRLNRLLCRLARNRSLLSLARQLHPDWAWKLSRSYARLRPHPSTYSSLPQGLKEALLKRPEELIIMGHYHCLVHQHLENGKEIFILGDWKRFYSYLRFDGRFQLFQDQGPGCPPLEVNPEP